MLTVRRTPLGSASLVAGALLMTACHSYAPVTSQAVPPGADAQVRLTDRGAADLSQFVGPYAREVRGRVASVDDSTIVLAVTELTRASGVDEIWRGETVSVPRSGVAEFALSRLSPSRTATFVASVVAIGVAVGLALGGGGSVGNKGPGPGDGGKQ